MSSTTPNMQLIVPDPEVTLGPEWAQLLVNALERIDEHDHTPGLGVALSSQSLTVDADLPLNGFNLTEIRTLRLETQGSTPVTANDLQIVFSEGGELYYRDASGNAVQITDNGSVAGASGSITNLGAGGSSANYNDTSKTFTWLYSPSKPGRMANSDIDLYPFDGTNTYTNNVTLKVNTTLAGDYSFILPDALPVRTAPLLVSGVGQVSAPVLNDGQLLIGSSGGAPAAASLTGTANQVNVSNGANSITLSLPQSIATTSSPQFANLSVTTNTSSSRIFLGNGSTSDASYAFINGNSGTGLSYDQANVAVRLSVAGSPWLIAATGGLQAYLQGGAVNTPSLAFAADQDTGMWFDSGNQAIQFSNNGVARLGIGTGGVNVTGNLAVTGSIETASGGAFKVKIVSGTSGSAAGTLDIAHGLDYTKVRGVTWAIYDPALSRVFIPTADGSSGTSVNVQLSSTNVGFSWNGLSGVTCNFYATITYVD